MNFGEYLPNLDLYLYIIKFYVFFALILIISYSLGNILLPYTPDSSNAEIMTLRLCLGLGAFSLIVMFLGQIGMLYYSVFLLIISGLLLNIGVGWYRSRSLFIWNFRLYFRRILNIESAVTFIAIFLSAIQYQENIYAFLTQPLFPPLSSDALIYHMANAKWYAEQHSLTPPYHMIVPIRAQTIQMLYTFGLVMGDENFAQLFSYIFVLYSCLVLITVGQRYFSLQSGVLAVVLFVSSAIPFLMMTAPIVDWGVTAFSCAVMFAFLRWFNTSHRNWVLLTGVFSGFAFTSKYQAIVLTCLLFSIIVFYSYQRSKLIHICVFILGFTLSSGLWLARTYYYCGQFISMSGNCNSIDLIKTAQNVPFKIYRTFLDKTGGENVLTENENDLLEKKNEASSINTRDTNTRVRLGIQAKKLYTVFYNIIGGYFLPQDKELYIYFSPYYLYLLPLAFLAARHNTNAKLSLVVSFIFLFAIRATDIEPRFAMPGIAILSLPVAYGVEYGLKTVFGSYKQAITRWALTIIVAGGLISNSRNYFRLTRDPLPITQQEKREYKSRYLPSYDAYAFMNDDKPNGYVVYQLYGHAMTYYINGIGLPADGREYDLDLVKRLLSDSDFLYNTLDSLNVDYLLVGENVWVSSSLPSPYQTFLDFEQDPVFNKRFKLKYKGKSYGKELWVYELQK